MGNRDSGHNSKRRPHLQWVLTGLVVVILLVAGYLLLQRGEPAQSEPTAAEVEQILPKPELQLSLEFQPAELNVILITLDTLRSDRLSCYGSERVETPNIDGFANEGVRFTNAASTVPFTLPAHASILTGTYPPYHGVRENVGAVLDQQVPTLAEMLGEAGWSTAGFVSAFVLDGRWGIDRGFDHYFDDFDLSSMDTPNMSSVQRSGDETITAAVDWLDQRPPEQPFFLWLHLYDPHEPYTPPEPYASQHPNRPYDGEVAYTDALIGDFRKALDERNLIEQSLVLLTSDHGEGLGDHGEMFHGYYIYESTIHVALIVRPPSAAFSGRVVDTAVSHVDLVPTVLDAVGLPCPGPLHGRSLVPLLVGEDISWERSVYSESFYPLLHYGWAPLRAIRNDRLKLIDVPRPELYDIVDDRGEEQSLYEQQPSRSQELEGRLAELRKEIERDEPASDQQAELDEESLAMLQALGYMAGQGGVSVDQEDVEPRADPKDKLALHQAIMAAQSRMELADKALEILERVLAEDDTIVDAHQMMGRIAGEQERYEDAEAHFQRALELDPNNRSSLIGLASTYLALERDDDALVGYRRLLALPGESNNAALAIADIHVKRRQLDEAAEVLEQAIASGNPPAIIHNKLGEVRVEQGRADEAVALFKRAIERAEEFPMPHFNLGVLHEERGEVAQTIACYERAIELEPRFFKAQFNLGRLYGKLGQTDRQQELLEASIESNPEFVQGHYYLAKLLMERGDDITRAEELARKGIELDPEHQEGPLGHYILADLLNRTGRRFEAREAARKGREIQDEMER
jgi:arylsulfatase A-like enzyme/lipopolysaccharide biosynthesis regulator YciM